MAEILLQVSEEGTLQTVCSHVGVAEVHVRLARPDGIEAVLHCLEIDQGIVGDDRSQEPDRRQVIADHRHIIGGVPGKCFVASDNRDHGALEERI